MRAAGWQRAGKLSGAKCRGAVGGADGEGAARGYYGGRRRTGATPRHWRRSGTSSEYQLNSYAIAYELGCSSERCRQALRDSHFRSGLELRHGAPHRAKKKHKEKSVFFFLPPQAFIFIFIFIFFWREIRGTR